MNTSENSISRKVMIEDSVRMRLTVLFNHEHGEAYTTFDPESGTFFINDIEVQESARRRGIGRALLSSVNNLTHEIGAKRVMASIVSRECLDAMQSVFGPENIEVYREGTYESDEEPESEVESTSAMLYYRPK